MDEETEESLAPLVDALTGAMAAVLLVSVFLMLSTVNGVSESLKTFGNKSLLEHEYLIDDALERKEPKLMLDTNSISFYKSFKLTEEQKKYSCFII
ncbi:hypothetical protein AT251_05600 [Enterovibrio nigricans]|nr:hypothetical protein [Enterovibrio nigricans]PKF51258.1 hypothetical protein AT251_05600 [Enterovibrio nigricans]